jgi:asparagine synthase (glutamine-hydrolysing)
MGAEEGRHFLPVLFSRKSQASIVHRDLWQTMSTFRPSAPLEEIAATARSPYERILLTYLKQYLPGLLVVEDKISMAHALESRTPFLDNELVALSLALSETVKLNGGQLKALVKSAAKGVLPDALLRMPKRGFPTPLRYWLRGELAGWMEDRISGRSSRLRLIFNDAFVDQAAARYRSSWRRNLRPLDEIATHRMWMLLSLESWLRQTEERYGITLTVK